MKLKNPRAPTPALRFSPTAWAKLLYLRDRGDSEVGGFGVASADDLLYVENVLLVKQCCNPISVRFDDESVADFFDAQVDRGLAPEQFARIWLHTHPGASPRPSETDEETFARVFGECTWAIMFILAECGQTYARLSFHTGPQGALEIPVQVDFEAPFAGSDRAAWEAEYQASVLVEEPLRPRRSEPLRLRADRGAPAAFDHVRDVEQDTAWDTWWDEDRRRWEEETLTYE